MWGVGGVSQIMTQYDLRGGWGPEEAKIVWHNKWTAPNIGCSEKLKNAKCDNSYSYSMAPWYIKKRENLIFLNFDRIIGFMVFESTGSIMVSMQKTVLKNMHRVLRYWQKCVKCYWFGLEGRFWTVFWYYLGTRCIFFKTDFCVETVRLSRSIWIP